MKQGLTEYVFIVDSSASMEQAKYKVVGTFNELLAQYRADCSDGLVTTIMFSERSKIFHDRAGIDSVQPLAQADYHPQGKTALLDAMGLTFKHIYTIHKYAREEDRPQKTVFIIITDGKEDASRIYRCSEIEQTISRRKEKNGWQFVFTGASLETILTSCKVAQQQTAQAAVQASQQETALADDLSEYVDDLLRLFENRKG